MSFSRHKCGFVLLALLSAGIANADNDFGLGLKAGTLGLGLEVTWQPLPYLEVRIGGNSYDYDEDGTQAGIPYEATMGLESFYGTANFHFPVSPMRVTAGIYANGNELLMVNDEGQDLNIGGVTYPGTDIGTLVSTTSFASTAPYLGIGFDFTLAGKVGLNLDFGVLWQGDPEVAIGVSGPLGDDPGFQAALELERQELEDEMNDFKAWPVLSLGFVYKF
jgi:hypothetical protein